MLNSNQLSRIAIYALVLLSVFATGCASVTGGTTQPIYVSTVSQTGDAVEGADCSLSNDKGQWKLRSPSDTTIARSNRPLIIKCDKAPLSQGAANVESSMRAAMFGNLLVGGVIGAVVDHTSGAAYEYPGVVKLTMGTSTNIKLQYDQNKNADKTAVSRSIPAPSLYAEISDVSKLPTNNERIRNDYQEFLKSAQPRAYAVSVDGRYGWRASGLTPSNKSQSRDPGERALENCRKNSKTACVLYAVDDQVVYVKPMTTTNTAANDRTSDLALETAVLQHTRAVPEISQYANISDAQAVPVSDQGKGRFLHYLTLPAPKAFVVYETGGWRFLSKDGEAMTKALDYCLREGKICWLYAVDDQVVWHADVTKRIGKTNQLKPLQ